MTPSEKQKEIAVSFSKYDIWQTSKTTEDNWFDWLLTEEGKRLTAEEAGTEKNHIVIVKCRWNDYNYVYPYLLTAEEAEARKAQRTNENNVASIKKVVYSS